MSMIAALWVMVACEYLAIMALASSRDNLLARVDELERRLGVRKGEA